MVKLALATGDVEDINTMVMKMPFHGLAWLESIQARCLF